MGVFYARSVPRTLRFPKKNVKDRRACWVSVGHHLRLQIKSKIDNTMCKLNVMLRFVEKGRLLSTVGRPFLIIKTFVFFDENASFPIDL